MKKKSWWGLRRLDPPPLTPSRRPSPGLGVAPLAPRDWALGLLDQTLSDSSGWPAREIDRSDRDRIVIEEQEEGELLEEVGLGSREKKGT